MLLLSVFWFMPTLVFLPQSPVFHCLGVYPTERKQQPPGGVGELGAKVGRSCGEESQGGVRI